MINELYEIYRARQESNAGVPQEQTKGIEESKKTEDSIEVIENDEMAKFYEKTELEEIKHLICGKISEDYDKKDKKLSNLKQSHNTISWQNGATTRVQEKSEVIQAHVSKRQSDKTFENIEESDSKTSLEAVAPTKVLCEQIEEDSKITEVNAKGASPSICKGNKADVAIEKLKNKKVAKMYEEEIDNRDEIMKNVNDDCIPKSADKKGNKRYRLVVDFRALNEKTIPDRYPLPNILDIIDQVGGAKYFSTLDLSNGFYQCLLREEDKHKTAFSTSFGLFHFKRLPMGCTNAPATFQRAMDNAFRATQKVLPMEEDFKELSERETGIYIDHFYNDLTEDFNFDEDLQLVMLDSEIEEEWTKVTTQLDSVFYKYTQAQNKSEGTKVTNLLNKIFRIEKDRMTLALRFKKLMNDVKDYHIPSDLLTPEQYTRIRSHLGGKYSIEGLPTLNTQTTINRVASIRHNIDKNVLLVEIQIPLEKEAAANIWEMTTYPVEQKWAKGHNRLFHKLLNFLYSLNKKSHQFFQNDKIESTSPRRRDPTMDSEVEDNDDDGSESSSGSDSDKSSEKSDDDSDEENETSSDSEPDQPLEVENINGIINDHLQEMDDLSEKNKWKIRNGVTYRLCTQIKDLRNKWQVKLGLKKPKKKNRKSKKNKAKKSEAKKTKTAISSSKNK
uniref:Reverse transcriptase domain-containing protein n=1 Tax=Trichogramma kaykai TaxID=54128 RepID=A0ABD2W7M7_9HYME